MGCHECTFRPKEGLDLIRKAGGRKLSLPRLPPPPNPPPGSPLETHRDDLLLPGVDHADLLVFGGRADQAAVAVPAYIVDHVLVHVVQVDQGLPGAHVPDKDGVVTAWEGEETEAGAAVTAC